MSDVTEDAIEVLHENAQHVIEYGVRRGDIRRLDLSPEDTQRIVDAARCLLAGDGLSPDKPVVGLDVPLTHALLRALSLRLLRQSATFEGETVLDRIECRDTFCDERIVLWFRVPAPELDDDEIAEDLAGLFAGLDKDTQ